MRKNLFGSARSKFFREPKRRTRSRPQKVKFRPRYAVSVFRRTGVVLWGLAKFIVVMSGLGFLGVSGWNFWHKSPALHIARVQFEEDVPPLLRESFPFNEGDNIVLANCGKLEMLYQKQFPELETISVSRGFNRTITVRGVYRKPIAYCERDGSRIGFGRDGVQFPLKAHNTPDSEPILMTGNMSMAQLQSVVTTLADLQTEFPRFYPLIKRLETDKMGTLQMVLVDGVVIEWYDEWRSQVVDKMKNILMVMDRYEPVKAPAMLRVVAKERIVIDANWRENRAKT